MSEDVGLPHDKSGGSDDGLNKKGAASSRPVGGAASRPISIAAALAAGAILPNERGRRFFYKALRKKANTKKRRLRKITAASKRRNRGK